METPRIDERTCIRAKEEGEQSCGRHAGTASISKAVCPAPHYDEHTGRSILTDTEQSLYERLGGQAAVDATVDRFYEKVLADESLAPFFEGLEMKRQAAKQKAFLTVAFGGPNRYTDRAMRAAHTRAREQGMAESHFDAVVAHLAETLRELGVGEADIDEVAAVAESVRDDVLGR